jgi:hypothetical protein
MRFSLTGSRCRAGWEKFSNFRGRLGQLTKIDTIPSIATFGSQKF